MTEGPKSDEKVARGKAWKRKMDEETRRQRGEVGEEVEVGLQDHLQDLLVRQVCPPQNHHHQ